MASKVLTSATRSWNIFCTNGIPFYGRDVCLILKAIGTRINGYNCIAPYTSTSHPLFVSSKPNEKNYVGSKNSFSQIPPLVHETTPETSVYVTTAETNASITPTLNELNAASVVVIPTLSSSIKAMPPKPELKFGHFLTDHILEVEWDADYGWHTPLIKATQPFFVHPAASCLHYGLQVFEGLKAYKRMDDKIVLFRPDMNFKRLNKSAVRMALPSCDPEQLCELVKRLVRQDAQFLPSGIGYSLYIRPLLISTQNTLGVAPPQSAKLIVMMSPCGSFYKTGYASIRLKAESTYCRSHVGGVGDCKAGGNYGPTIYPQKMAAKEGFSQILWLFPKEDDFILTEVGVMNLFVFLINSEGKKELLTPALDDNLILAGITRDSVIQLAKSYGDFDVVERSVFMKRDVVSAYKEGRLLEMFGTGTAAGVVSISEVAFLDETFSIPGGESSMGPLAKRLTNSLNSIQYGCEPHEWVVEV